MANANDKANAAKLKEAFGLDPKIPIRVQYNTNEKVVYKEYGGGKDRSGEFTDAVRKDIASGNTVKPDPSQVPTNGKRSAMQVKALIDGKEEVVFRQERDGTVTINDAYERAIAKAKSIDNEADRRPAASVVESIKPKLPKPAQVEKAAAAEERARVDKAAGKTETVPLIHPTSETRTVAAKEEAVKESIRSDIPVTIEAPKPAIAQAEPVTIEAPRTNEIVERSAPNLQAIPSKVYEPGEWRGNQTQEERLARLSSLTDKIKDRVSEAGQRALENVKADADRSRANLQARAAAKLSELGNKAKESLSVAKDKAVERAKADSQILIDNGREKARKDIKATVSGAKSISAELGVSAIATSRYKINAALQLASRGTAAARDLANTIDRKSQQIGNWAARMAKVADDREVARAAAAKWKEGNDRTGANSFSIGNGMTVSKEDSTISVKQGSETILATKVDEKGKPDEINSRNYDINQVRDAMKTPATGSEAVENRYQMQSEAIIKMSKQAFTVQAGHVEPGETAKVRGKSYNYEMRENGDFAVTRAKDGKEVLVEKASGEIESKLSKSDINRFANAAQAQSRAEQKQEAAAVR